MHPLGKWFLGVTALFAVINIPLAALLLGHQSHWMTQIDGLEDQLEQNRGQVETLRQSVTQTRNEINRIMDGWGQRWRGVRAEGLGTEPRWRMYVGIGTGSGLPTADDPRANRPLHLFQDAGEETVYLGAFQVDNVLVDEATLTYVWPVTGDEPQIAGEVRVRELIPPSVHAAVGDLHAEQAIADQALDAAQSRLQTQEELLQQSQLLLDQRLAELNGLPDPPPDVSREVAEGLLATIRREESARDEALAVLDRLRREFSRKRERLNRLIEENRQLVERLPGNGSNGRTAGGPGSERIDTTATIR